MSSDIPMCATAPSSLGTPRTSCPAPSGPACRTCAMGFPNTSISPDTSWPSVRGCSANARRCASGSAIGGRRVCIATVGGSGVGVHLMRRIAQSYDLVRAELPDLRMILVAGPGSTRRRWERRRCRGAGLRAGPEPTSRRLRRGARARRLDDVHGTDRRGNAVIYFHCGIIERITTSRTVSTATAPGGAWHLRRRHRP